MAEKTKKRRLRTVLLQSDSAELQLALLVRLRGR